MQYNIVSCNSNTATETNTNSNPNPTNVNRLMKPNPNPKCLKHCRIDDSSDVKCRVDLYSAYASKPLLRCTH